MPAKGFTIGGGAVGHAEGKTGGVRLSCPTSFVHEPAEDLIFAASAELLLSQVMA